MLPDSYPIAPRVRVNLVQSSTGLFADASGSSRGISTQADRKLLLELREQADVVVTDGETARLEKYRVPLACDLAVITRNGYTPAQSSSKRRYVELNEELNDALKSLQAMGYAKILLEVGPGLLSNAWDQIDQLCLTTTGFGEPNLKVLGVNGSEIFRFVTGESTFTVWSQIQPL